MSIASDAVSTYAGQRSPLNPITRLLNGLRLVATRFQQYREHRDSFRALLALDDALLADIGVTRKDVQWASHLPLGVDASLELRKLAESRRRNA